MSESHSSGAPEISLAATVAVGFAVLTLSFGARALIGLGMPTWGAELAWSKSSLSAAGALALCVVALVVSFGGYVFDRWGPCGILALGCGALTAALKLWVYFNSAKFATSLLIGFFSPISATPT